MWSPCEVWCCELAAACKSLLLSMGSMKTRCLARICYWEPQVSLLSWSEFKCQTKGVAKLVTARDQILPSRLEKMNVFPFLNNFGSAHSPWKDWWWGSQESWSVLEVRVPTWMHQYQALSLVRRNSDAFGSYLMPQATPGILNRKAAGWALDRASKVCCFCPT